MLWKGQDRIRLLLCPPKQQKLNICGSMRIHCKIDSPGYGGGSVDLIEPRPDRVSSHVIHGYQVNGAGQGQMVDTVCFFVPCYAVCGAGSFLSLILHTFLLYAPLSGCFRFRHCINNIQHPRVYYKTWKKPPDPNWSGGFFLLSVYTLTAHLILFLISFPLYLFHGQLIQLMGRRLCSRHSKGKDGFQLISLNKSMVFFLSAAAPIWCRLTVSDKLPAHPSYRRPYRSPQY